MTRFTRSPKKSTEEYRRLFVSKVPEGWLKRIAHDPALSDSFDIIVDGYYTIYVEEYRMLKLYEEAGKEIFGRSRTATEVKEQEDRRSKMVNDVWKDDNRDSDRHA
jgi:hypothetical protein